MKNKYDLTIIVVNYNGRFWLKKTLESLKEFYLNKTNSQVKTIVVDNHSNDDSTSLIKRSFRWVELIELPENLGFAAGNNVALTQALKDSEFIMLLNSDTQLTDDSNLDELIQVLNKRADIGIITPKLVLSSGEIDLACHRGEPTLWASATYFLGLETSLPQNKLFSQYHQTYKDLNALHTIDACSGAAMIIRTSAIKKVGLLDEQFFMYAEDLDWCRRFREAGYLILYYPLVTIIHHKHKSGIQSNFQVRQRETRSHFYDTMLQYFDKHNRGSSRMTRWLVKTIINLKKGV